MRLARTVIIVMALVVARLAPAQESPTPRIEAFDSHGAKVGARLFMPARPAAGPRPAIACGSGRSVNISIERPRNYPK